MRFVRIFGITLSLAIILLWVANVAFPNRSDKTEERYLSMKIESPAFNQNEEIPSEYTCDGADKSPELVFADVPNEAKSLALIVDDPDAPAGTWVHWTLWNIRPDISIIEPGIVPDGAREGRTDFGSTGYGGPCPQSGTHRYRFTLYALDRELDIAQGAASEDLRSELATGVVAEAILVGRYEKLSD